MRQLWRLVDGIGVYQDFGFGLCATKCRIALSSMKNPLAAHWNKICKRIYAMHANNKNPNWWVGEEAGCMQCGKSGNCAQCNGTGEALTGRCITGPWNRPVPVVRRNGNPLLA